MMSQEYRCHLRHARARIRACTHRYPRRFWWAHRGRVPDLMRIGGFVQLKRLTKIHPGLGAHSQNIESRLCRSQPLLIPALYRYIHIQPPLPARYPSLVIVIGLRLPNRAGNQLGKQQGDRQGFMESYFQLPPEFARIVRIPPRHRAQPRKQNRVNSSLQQENCVKTNKSDWLKCWSYKHVVLSFNAF